MLPLARGEHGFRNWATGCSTKGNPLETAGNADLTGESADSNGNGQAPDALNPRQSP